MPIVVGICFKPASGISYFDPDGMPLKEGDFVLAETARGVEFGEVVTEPKWVEEEEVVRPLRKVIRKATVKDIAQNQENERKEREALAICLKKVEEDNLPIKIVDVEYIFDGTLMSIFFTSESKVNLQKLAQDLANSFRTRVELHQIGARDEAKLMGGIGPCGRPLCCASFLSSFESVSIKMAKEQNLAINPVKLSGICGRLMCCLKYEYEMYQEMKQALPKVGSEVQTPQGRGKVVDIEVLKGNLVVELPELGQIKVPAKEVEIITREP